ncbi:M1 family aminopeptidase, partial [Rhodococcus sp. HNM0569]|uniref:M1 family aminopeptidase n=1 Tax=Rhodococcus sp. HNM0569 TaxID=2716340 RepID=UPI0016A4D302
DDLFEVTRQGLDFYADHFGYPYPFGKYDQVFVPEYNLGAMENPGCVTFTESYVFRGAATQDQYARRANTILHEMAHMWFGDLVTPVWWDDLWLKESFADLMGSLVSAEATRFTDAWVSFANRRKAWAYQQDQLPTTHPVVAEIPDLEAAKLNFDGITYAKGAAVLKQLMAHVGRDAFFTAARNYFQAFEFANTRLTDLLAALSAASGRDLAAWSRQWLESTGVSTLSWDGTHVVQTLPKPTTLAIGCYSFDETGDLVRIDRRAVELTEERTPIDLPSADLVLLNDEDLTYAKARLDERSLATVESSLDRLRDPLARGLVWSSVWNATRDAELAAPRFVSMVSRFAAGETDPALLAGVLANAGFAVEHFVADEGRAAARRAWLDTAWHNLHEAPAASDAQLTWARTVASAAAYDDARAADLGALLDGRTSVDGLQLDPDLRWALLTALAATGHVDLG